MYLNHRVCLSKKKTNVKQIWTSEILDKQTEFNDQLA